MRTFVRIADSEEIIEASDQAREVTQNLLKGRPRQEVWTFEAPDFREVLVRNPNRSILADNSVASAKAVWTRQADNGDTSARADLRKVAELESDLRRERRFRQRPILQDVTEKITLHDGRHRLVAAYECWSNASFRGPIEVFWVMPADATPQ